MAAVLVICPPDSVSPCSPPFRGFEPSQLTPSTHSVSQFRRAVAAADIACPDLSLVDELFDDMAADGNGNRLLLTLDEIRGALRDLGGPSGFSAQSVVRDTDALRAPLQVVQAAREAQTNELRAQLDAVRTARETQAEQLSTRAQLGAVRAAREARERGQGSPGRRCHVHETATQSPGHADDAPSVRSPRNRKARRSKSEPMLRPAFNLPFSHWGEPWDDSPPSTPPHEASLPAVGGRRPTASPSRVSFTFSQRVRPESNSLPMLRPPK